MQESQGARATVDAESVSEGFREPGVVVPLFRGSQPSTQPLVTVGGGLWRKQDVMAHFDVASRTVERWQLEGGLPHEKPFGPKGPVRYDPRRVLAWWQARCANEATSLALGAGVVLQLLRAWLS